MRDTGFSPAAFSPAGTRHLPALTVLRFPAALAVLVYHYFGAAIAALPGGEVWGAPAIHGYLGVVFFFVLSGFILAHVHGGDPFGPASGRSVRQRFYRARIARVGPVLWLSLALGLPVFAKTLLGGGGIDPVVQGLALILAPLGLHAWVPGAACSLTCPTWSLSVEAFFYLLFPFLVGPVLAAPRRALLLALLLGAGLAGLGDWLWLRATGGVDPLLTYLPDSRNGQILRQALLYNPLLHLPGFVAGIAGYALWARRAAREEPSPGIYVLGVLGAVLLYGWADALPPVLRSTVLPVPVFLLLIMGCAGLRWQSPRLEWLGQISFALYAVHVPIYQIVASRTLMGDGVPAGLVATLLSLAAAAMVHRWVEIPARRWLLSRFKAL